MVERACFLLRASASGSFGDTGTLQGPMASSNPLRAALHLWHGIKPSYKNLFSKFIVGCPSIHCETRRMKQSGVPISQVSNASWARV